MSKCWMVTWKEERTREKMFLFRKLYFDRLAESMGICILFFFLCTTVQLNIAFGRCANVIPCIGYVELESKGELFSSKGFLSLVLFHFFFSLCFVFPFLDLLLAQMFKATSFWFNSLLCTFPIDRMKCFDYFNLQFSMDMCVCVSLRIFLYFVLL